MVKTGVSYNVVQGATDNARILVTDRFVLAKTLAIEQVNATRVYLVSLTSLFTNAEMPTIDINYEHQDITLESDIRSDRPEPPSDLAPKDVSDPVIGTLNTISIPTITIPSYTLVAPTGQLSYNEAIYQSALQDALKAALQAFIAGGGTGLGSDVEAALWARAQDRQALINERTYNEAEEYFASRGYTIPPGALGGRLTEALIEQTRADAQLNYEISIEQARLARAQSEYTMNASITLEGQDKELFNNIASRALEAAKATIQVIVDLYDAKVREYIAKIEGDKTRAEIAKLQVDATVAVNNNIVDTYKADVEAYKAKVQMELGIVEQVARVYGYKIAGYEADAKVAAADLDAQIKVYQGDIEQANNQTTLTLKEAELTIQSYLGALQLTSESIKAGGNISAQIAAAALSAINASASLGAQASSSYGGSQNDNYTENTTESISEMHYYDETAI